MKKTIMILCLTLLTFFANIAYADYFADAGKVTLSMSGNKKITQKLDGDVFTLTPTGQKEYGYPVCNIKVTNKQKKVAVDWTRPVYMGVNIRKIKSNSSRVYYSITDEGGGSIYVYDTATDNSMRVINSFGDILPNKDGYDLQIRNNGTLVLMGTTMGKGTTSEYAELFWDEKSNWMGYRRL